MKTWAFVLVILAIPTSVLAGSRLLQNDDFSGMGEVAFQGGFIDGECWASVYKPGMNDYPFDIEFVDALVGGTSGTEAFDVEIFALNDTNIANASSLGVGSVTMTGSNDSLNRITVSDLELGLGEISSGNFAVAVCLSNFGGYPAIARDSHADYAKQNYIWGDIGLGWNWYQASLLGVNGDWIMRACITGDNIAGDECSEGDSDTDSDADTDTDSDSDADSDTDTDTAFDLEIMSITPDSMIAGVPEDVVILGSGFYDGVEARIGGISLTGTEVINSETINGRTPSSLPVGTHDVEVVLDGDSAYLAGAFVVEEEGEEGCGCSSSLAAGGLFWVGIGLLAARRRRKS